MEKTILVDTNLSKPKYRQVMDSIINGIENKHFVKGERVPSINSMSSSSGFSRDTIILAFNELRSMGIIKSQLGKGFYIASTNVKDENIFVLFDELNAFKEELYNSFIKTLKGKVNVDIYFHNHNFKVFKSLILKNAGNYTSYVIMPSALKSTVPLISEELPSGKVYILDRLKPELKNYPVVYQDFEQDYYDALVEGFLLLKKYKKLVFVNPGGKEHGQRAAGFSKFCEENNFKFEVIKSLAGIRTEPHEAYFLVLDSDLIEILKIAKDCNYKPGKNFGIVSLNDNMLKEVVANGITTISTDFAEMGKIMAKMIIEKKCEQIRNPSKLIVRNSL